MPCACGFVLLPPPILIGVVVVVVVVSSIQSGVFFVSSLLSLFFLLLLVSVLKKFCHACFFCLSCVCFLSLFSCLLSVKIRLSFCIKKSKARRQLKNLSRLSSKILAEIHPLPLHREISLQQSGSKGHKEQSMTTQNHFGESNFFKPSGQFTRKFTTVFIDEGPLGT